MDDVFDERRRPKPDRKYIEALQSVLQSNSGRIVFLDILDRLYIADRVSVDPYSVALRNFGVELLRDMHAANPVVAGEMLRTFFCKQGL